MTEQEARELIVHAGHKLAETGLITRTWGNISCRLDGESFLITPSGRAYDTLTPEDMVICKILDASHDGDKTPSVEKGVHALIYRERSNAGFVIHTHQKWASAIAASDVGKVNDAPVAAYGLPGSKKLTRRIGEVLLEADDSLLLKHHGAICFGVDCEAAFAAANKLEADCQRLIIESYIKKSGDKRPQDLRHIFDYCAGSGNEAADDTAPLKAESRRDGDGMMFTLDGAEQHYTKISAYMPEEAKLHEAVYNARPDVLAIKTSSDDAVMSAACAGKQILPMLDDFAQCVGASVRIADNESGIADAMKGNRGAVIVAGRGVMCCSATDYEAESIKLIVEKTAAAMLTSKLFGEPKPISPLDCFLMRRHYLQKYSKLARK